MNYSGRNSLSKLIELIKNKFDTKLDSTANAVSASKIAEPVTLSFTGGVSGSVSFDGSEDVDISLDVLTGGVYVGTGDMPDGYNVQIDPSGDAFGPVTVSLTGDVAGSATFDGSADIEISTSVQEIDCGSFN